MQNRLEVARLSLTKVQILFGIKCMHHIIWLIELFVCSSFRWNFKIDFLWDPRSSLREHKLASKYLAVQPKWLHKEIYALLPTCARCTRRPAVSQSAGRHRFKSIRWFDCVRKNECTTIRMCIKTGSGTTLGCSLLRSFENDDQEWLSAEIFSHKDKIFRSPIGRALDRRWCWHFKESKKLYLLSFSMSAW